MLRFPRRLSSIGFPEVLRRAAFSLTSRHTLALGLAAAAPGLLLRALALLLHFAPDDFGFEAAARVCRGASSDVVFAYLAGAAAAPFLAARRRIFAPWVLGWSFIAAANLEHIRYNGSNLDALLLRYAVAPEFITGNVLVGAVLLPCLGAAAVTLLVLWRLEKAELQLRPRAVALPLSAAALALAIPTSPRYDDWVQEALLESNLRRVLAHAAPEESSSPFDAERPALDPTLKEKYLGRDLGGERRFEPRVEKPNVLLILIEGLGERYVNEETMPFLHRLGGDNLRFSNFFAHAHPTIKGLYSLLAGEYPNLTHYDSKSDILGTFGTRRQLLPRLLDDQGYATVFLQGAALGYMRKDLFAGQAGFEAVYGAGDFASSHRSGRWGVDDRTLFERALDEIDRLERPWMMTLLTSGTHPPYNVPEGFRGKEKHHTLEDALFYTDTYLGELLHGLERIGALESTLVFITADEVKGAFPAGVAGAIDRNRSPLIVCTPERHAEGVEEYYGQIDLALSVLDYLGAETIPEATIGRSLFRRYDTFRRMLVGKGGDLIVLEEPDRVHFVRQRLTAIESYRKTAVGFQPLSGTEALIDEAKRVVRHNDLTLSGVDAEYIFRERKRYLSGAVPLVWQLSISARKGELLSWEIGLDTNDLEREVIAVEIQAGVPDEKGEYRYLVRDLDVVGPKSRFSLHRTIEAPQDFERLDNFISVRTPPGKRVFLEYAHIKRQRR